MTRAFDFGTIKDMATTSIEWTEATWNPVRGCTKISPGCKHFYAETFAERWRGVPGHPYEQGFDLRLVPEKLAEPLRRRKPTTYFVNSMSDLFHEQVPFEYIAAVFGVMAACPQHTFQVLTKRPERMREWLAWIVEQLPSCHPRGPARGVLWHAWDRGVEAASPTRNEHATWPLPNVWLGVSVEDRKHGLPRIEHLRRAPFALRGLSIEPLLEDLGELDLAGIDWVIVGGEGGYGARPMHPEWARSIRDQCVAAGVPFFFKQHGDWRPAENGDVFNTADGASGRSPAYNLSLDGTVHCFHKDSIVSGVPMLRVGKSKAGRELDGRTWDDMPRRRA